MVPIHAHNYAEQLRGYVDAHLDEPLTLTQIAAMRSMSPSTFCHHFRRVVGQTPMGFIREIRLTHALTLLRTTDDSITDIAVAVGYRWTSHFCKAFRAATGLSPMEYRLQQRIPHPESIMPRIALLWAQAPPQVQTAVVTLLEAVVHGAGTPG